MFSDSDKFTKFYKFINFKNMTGRPKKVANISKATGCRFQLNDEAHSI